MPAVFFAVPKCKFNVIYDVFHEFLIREVVVRYQMNPATTGRLEAEGADILMVRNKPWSSQFQFLNSSSMKSLSITGKSYRSQFTSRGCAFGKGCRPVLNCIPPPQLKQAGLRIITPFISCATTPLNL